MSIVINYKQGAGFIGFFDAEEYVDFNKWFITIWRLSNQSEPVS